MASKKVQNQRHQCSQNHRATRSMNQPFAMVKDAAAKQQRLLLIEDDDPDDEFPTPEPFTKQDLDSFIIETDSISECDNVTSLFSDCISLAGLKCRRDCCRDSQETSSQPNVSTPTTNTNPLSTTICPVENINTSKCSQLEKVVFDRDKKGNEESISSEEFEDYFSCEEDQLYCTITNRCRKMVRQDITNAKKMKNEFSNETEDSGVDSNPQSNDSRTQCFNYLQMTPPLSNQQIVEQHPQLYIPNSLIIPLTPVPLTSLSSPMPTKTTTNEQTTNVAQDAASPKSLPTEVESEKESFVPTEQSTNNLVVDSENSISDIKSTEVDIDLELMDLKIIEVSFDMINEMSIKYDDVDLVKTPETLIPDVETENSVKQITVTDELPSNKDKLTKNNGNDPYEFTDSESDKNEDVFRQLEPSTKNVTQIIDDSVTHLETYQENQCITIPMFSTSTNHSTEPYNSQQPTSSSTDAVLTQSDQVTIILPCLPSSSKATNPISIENIPNATKSEPLIVAKKSQPVDIYNQQKSTVLKNQKKIVSDKTFVNNNDDCFQGGFDKTQEPQQQRLPSFESIAPNSFHSMVNHDQLSNVPMNQLPFHPSSPSSGFNSNVSRYQMPTTHQGIYQSSILDTPDSPARLEDIDIRISDNEVFVDSLYPNSIKVFDDSVIVNYPSNQIKSTTINNSIQQTPPQSLPPVPCDEEDSDFEEVYLNRNYTTQNDDCVKYYETLKMHCMHWGCTNKFFDKESYRCHLIQEHQMDLYVCFQFNSKNDNVQCDFKCAKYNQMLEHNQMEHAKNRQWNCSTKYFHCTHTFSNYNQLFNHIRDHHTTGWFKCIQTTKSKCSYGSRTPSAIVRHLIQSHPNVICNYPECEKIFSNKFNLIRHQQAHIQYRPFYCGYNGCGRHYQSKYLLQSHIELKHFNTEDDEREVINGKKSKAKKRIIDNTIKDEINRYVQQHPTDNMKPLSEPVCFTLNPYDNGGNTFIVNSSSDCCSCSNPNNAQCGKNQNHKRKIPQSQQQIYYYILKS
ncbi:hypothetical protein BLOT_015588 [Blomia tropicalis]|nr:hypothetical protein BLOT_015588 [Blomia tropicalis]